MMDAPIDRGQTPESRSTFARIDNVMWWLTVNLPTPPVGAPSILFKSMPCLLVSVRTAVGATVSQAGAAADQEGRRLGPHSAGVHRHGDHHGFGPISQPPGECQG